MTQFTIANRMYTKQREWVVCSFNLLRNGSVIARLIDNPSKVVMPVMVQTTDWHLLLAAAKVAGIEDWPHRHDENFMISEYIRSLVTADEQKELAAAWSRPTLQSPE